MALPPPSTTHTSNLLSTHRALLDTLSSFLTVAIHHTLYLRRIYPPVSFLAVRAYNYPVRQSRHPAVAGWIRDAVAAVRDQMEKGSVDKIAICIYECDRNAVLERWTLDLRQFPRVDRRERDVPFVQRGGMDGEEAEGQVDPGLMRRKINVADLEAQFRATLSRLSVASGKLKALPEGPGCPEYSFTLTMEVKDDADRPVGRLEAEERKWIAAEPDMFEIDSDEGQEEGGIEVANKQKRHIGGKTIPVRRLEVGELRLEMWIEESKAKFDLLTSTASTAPTSSSEQQTGDQRSFDLEHAYDLEPADVNRKPQGGAFTDYRR